MKAKSGRGAALFCAFAVAAAAAGCGPTQPTIPDVSRPTSAVVGGTGEDPANYPYFAEVIGAAHYCGGSLITDSWVLTALHCVDSDAEDPRYLSVTLPSLPPDRVQATAVIPHPLWDRRKPAAHDVALIHLPDGAFAGVSQVQVGTPWDPAAYAANTPATVMGYGDVSGSGAPSSSGFQVANTVLRSDADMHIFADWNDQLMIGAGTPEHTTCHGDSGGPLVVTRNGRPVQVGVVDFGTEHCDKPGGFAELAGPTLAWIASVVPSIMNGWGTCTTANGSPGRSAATYGTNRLQGPHTDGGYYWNIQCVSTDARLMQVRHSARCGNVVPSGLESGNNLVQNSCVNQLYNLFELSPSDNGHYRLVVAATGNCLGVEGSSKDWRAKVKQYSCGYGWNQQWDLRATDNGYYQVVARHSQMCMDVQGDYLTNGAYIWQYPCDLGYNQQFRFIQQPDCPQALAGHKTPDGRVCPQPTDIAPPITRPDNPDVLTE